MMWPSTLGDFSDEAIDKLFIYVTIRNINMNRKKIKRNPAKVSPLLLPEPLPTPPLLKSMQSPAPRRGRPRSEHLHAAMLDAARALLAQGGLPAVTMEAIAERAGVGKPTVYRYWPNAHAVAMAAMMDSESAAFATGTMKRAKPAAGTKVAKVVAKATKANQSSANALVSLSEQLRAIAKAFTTPIGRNVTLMIASADSQTELSKVFRNHFILARREEGRDLLKLAIKQGEVRSDIDFDVALDLIYGPLFYRLLSGHARLNAEFTEGLLLHALKGLQTT
jgi:AcrR family transcriptional regulator